MNLKSYLRGAGIGIIITALILMVSGGHKSHAMTDEEIMARARDLGMTGGNEVLTEAYTMATAPDVTPEVTAASETSAEPASETPAEPASEAAAQPPSETVSSEALDAPSETAESGTASEVSGTVSAESADESTESASADQIIEGSLEGKQTKSLTSDLTGENKKKSELLADAVETAEESASPVTDSSSGFVSIHVNGGSSSTAVAKALENAGAVSSAGAFDAYLCAKGYDRHLSTGDFRIPAGASDEDIALILMRRK